MAFKIERADELSKQELDELEKDEDRAVRDNYDLMLLSAEIHSPMKELNKDFTLSNLSDAMFDSRVVKFIMGRMFLVELVKLLFPYANKRAEKEKEKDKNGKEIEESEDVKISGKIPENIRMNIKWQTYEYNKCKNLVLNEVYTILNMSKARGGLVLKAFLRGQGLSNEEAEAIVGGDGGPAQDEMPKRTVIDRVLGRNKPTRHKI